MHIINIPIAKVNIPCTVARKNIYTNSITNMTYSHIHDKKNLNITLFLPLYAEYSQLILNLNNPELNLNIEEHFCNEIINEEILDHIKKLRLSVVIGTFIKGFNHIIVDKNDIVIENFYVVPIKHERYEFNNSFYDKYSLNDINLYIETPLKDNPRDTKNLIKSIIITNIITTYIPSLYIILVLFICNGEGECFKSKLKILLKILILKGCITYPLLFAYNLDYYSKKQSNITKYISNCMLSAVVSIREFMYMVA